MSTGRQLYNTSSAAAAWRYQRRQYLKLLHQKSSEFWTTRIDAEQSQPRRLWRSFDQLLGRCRASPSTDLDATQLHRFFNDKVAAVRAATAGADQPTFTAKPSNCVFQTFTPVTPHDVVALVKQLPDKQCASDPLPT